MYCILSFFNFVFCQRQNQQEAFFGGIFPQKAEPQHRSQRAFRSECSSEPRLTVLPLSWWCVNILWQASKLASPADILRHASRIPGRKAWRTRTVCSLVVGWSDWHSTSNSQQTVNVRENVGITGLFTSFDVSSSNLGGSIEPLDPPQPLSPRLIWYSWNQDGHLLQYLIQTILPKHRGL